MRIIDQIERGAPLTISVDGEPLAGFDGETVAALMLAAGRTAFRVDGRGHPRGLYCNMGTCCECTVMLHGEKEATMLRACLLPARDGQRITTGTATP